jgi:hypothetical protein
MRWREQAGTGRKPSDDLVAPLCRRCHEQQESREWPDAEWWCQHVLKPMLRREYREWLQI